MVNEKNKNQPRILIVEDDLIIAENLRENLLELGYTHIDVTTDSTHAIQLYRTHKPDICLVDVQLNGSQKDGIETMEYLNAGKEIPVIYLTSFADEVTRERAKSTYPAAYLIKPANKSQIDVTIDIALNNFYNKKENIAIPLCPLFSGNGFIFLKVKNKDIERYEKFYLKDIEYLKAEGSYTQLYSGDKAPVVTMNLLRTLSILNDPNIIRCHRSYAVNIQHVHSFDHSGFFIIHNNAVINIPIGDQYRTDINIKVPKF